MLITNCTHLDWADMGGMSPSTTKVTLGSEARGRGVSWSRLTTMGTNIEGAILSIVTEVMTPKAFGEGRGWSTMNGDMDDSSGGGEDSCSIGERLKKGPVEGKDLFIYSFILGLRFYGSRRGSAGRGRRRRELRQKCGQGG